MLFVTASALYPPVRGTSVRVAAMVDYFHRRGWETSIVHCSVHPEVRDDYFAIRSICERVYAYFPSRSELGQRRQQTCDAWCPDGLARLVAHVCLTEGTDVVIAHYSYLSKCFLHLDGARPPLKVLDADNLFSGRSQRFQGFALPYVALSTTREDEAAALRRAEVILAIQELEAREFRSMAPEVPVLVVPHGVDAPDCGAADGHDILLVGSRYHANAEGLLRFLSTAFPEVRAAYPDARLIVAGELGQVLAAGIDGVEVAGVVPDLDALYRSAAVVINPVPAQTGLSIKSVEALARGKCLVTTPAGAQGIPGAGVAMAVLPDAEQFGGAIVGLFADRRRLVELGRAAREMATGHFSSARAFGPLADRLEERVSAASEVR